MSKNFESAFKALNTITEEMEKGGLSLNDSLKKFEKGIALIRECQLLLQTAEQKIQLYNKSKATLENFNSPDESESDPA